MKIQIKKIEDKYMNEVIDLLQNISNFKPDNSEYKSIFNSFIEQNDVIGIVAVVKENKFTDEKVAGFGSVHMTKRIRGGTVGIIEDIAVFESFRRQGIGRLIVTNLIENARNKKCFKLILDCKEDTKLFYEKIGFCHSGCSMTLSL